MAPSNSKLKAAEYRDLATQASARAEASLLDHVRAKHELAADKWASLAEIMERPMSPRPL